VVSRRPLAVVLESALTARTSALMSATLRMSASRTTWTSPNGPWLVGISINVCTST
jgi:hypothetical protein